MRNFGIFQKIIFSTFQIFQFLDGNKTSKRFGHDIRNEDMSDYILMHSLLHSIQVHFILDFHSLGSSLDQHQAVVYFDDIFRMISRKIPMCRKLDFSNTLVLYFNNEVDAGIRLVT